ncbi:IPT/TIG domain-containing protein [Jatrophihabitans sp.]|uniref:IPT/TIG domain-containing protein n=1 Tax=Jatrophihabitans sp. TaxID=1932789 RepID=UPI0030C6D391
MGGGPVLRRLVMSASIAVGLVAAAAAAPVAASASSPAPSVSAVAPAVGSTAGGTTVTITGKGFTSVRDVEFGATKVAKVKVLSSTKLTVLSPKHARARSRFAWSRPPVRPRRRARASSSSPRPPRR